MFEMKTTKLNPLTSSLVSLDKFLGGQFPHRRIVKRDCVSRVRKQTNIPSDFILRGCYNNNGKIRHSVAPKKRRRVEVKRKRGIDDEEDSSRCFK